MSRQSLYNEAQLSKDELYELFSYDPTTGEFKYKTENKYRVQQKVGNLAGCVNKHGYRYIKIKGTPYKAARLAFLYMTGAWPAGEVDHINGDKGDDRFDNLRDLPSIDNSRNNKSARTNRYHGICHCGNRFTVQFRVNREIKYFGVYDTLEEARIVAVAAKQQLGLYNHVEISY